MTLADISTGLKIDWESQSINEDNKVRNPKQLLQLCETVVYDDELRFISERLYSKMGYGIKKSSISEPNYRLSPYYIWLQLIAYDMSHLYYVGG